MPEWIGTEGWSLREEQSLRTPRDRPRSKWGELSGMTTDRHRRGHLSQCPEECLVGLSPKVRNKGLPKSVRYHYQILSEKPKLKSSLYCRRDLKVLGSSRITLSSKRRLTLSIVLKYLLKAYSSVFSSSVSMCL